MTQSDEEMIKTWTEMSKALSDIKYRPWTVEEVPIGTIIKYTNSRCRAMIVSARPQLEVGEKTIGVGNKKFTPHYILNWFVMPDGSRCGTLITKDVAP